jgi:hypothetical protein
MRFVALTYLSHKTTCMSKSSATFTAYRSDQRQTSIEKSRVSCFLSITSKWELE